MTQMADRPISDLWIGFRSLNGDYYWTDGQPRRYVNLGFKVSVFFNVMWGSTRDNVFVWKSDTLFLHCRDTTVFDFLR